MEISAVHAGWFALKKLVALLFEQFVFTPLLGSVDVVARGIGRKFLPVAIISMSTAALIGCALVLSRKSNQDTKHCSVF